MSSSYRKGCSGLFRFIAGAAVLSSAQLAVAADAYFVPAVTVLGSYHTNAALESNVPEHEDLSAYTLDAGAVLGWRSPRSVTELFPRAIATRYPDEKLFDGDELYLALRHNFSGLKSKFDLYGEYANVESITSEFDSARFDQFDPNDPTVGSTGRVLSSTTIERMQLRPSYSYQVTQRTALGANLLADSRRYSGGSTGSDYDFLFLNPFVSRSLDERTSLAFGGTASRYETKSKSNQTEAYGLSLDWNRRWTPTYSGGFMVRVEQNDIKLRGAPKETSTDWSVLGHLERRGEIDTLRLSIGQVLSPSGAGYKTATDELRVEYGRPLSARWEFNTAVRGLRVRDIGGGSGEDDRDYAIGQLSIKWAMTRTWNLLAYYNYTWQKYTQENGSNNDNAIFIGIGYQGLSPPPL